MNSTRFPITIHSSNKHELMLKWLKWADQFPFVQLLYPAEFDYPHGTFPKMGIVSNEAILCNENAFETLKSTYNQYKTQGVFMHYELKDEVEKLTSKHPLPYEMPKAGILNSQLVFHFNDDFVIIEYTEKYTLQELENIWLEINQSQLDDSVAFDIQLKSRTSRKEYLEKVKKIKNHIEEGDMYEMNYCIDFYAEDIEINPLSVFNELLKITHTPFCCFLKVNELYVFSLSPERFLKKTANRLISQPIKGTAARHHLQAMDDANKKALQESEKEKAENLMIVDLVRNDLARSCKSGSVKVEELFGIYSFPKVHQMISTISAELKETIHPIDALKVAFPMGSMTGAPKIKVMEMIETFENSKRGIYSGAIGYFDKNGDFDFNVVIRSLVYDNKNKKINFHVGSAITYDSVPEQEYEEVLLKAKAFFEIFGSHSE